MKILNAVAVAGIVGTFALTQLIGSAFAVPPSDPLTDGQNLLASYEQTNKQLGSCMHDRELGFNDEVTKTDVTDAFRPVMEADPSDRTKERVEALWRDAVEDPNKDLVASMTAAEKTSWAAALNECSQRLEDELSGGVESAAKIQELQRAAASSPEVQAAAQNYVTCMGDQGFNVDSNPFVAPQAVSEAAHQDYSPEVQELLDGYNGAWRTCVEPYQRTYDQKLFGKA